LCFCILSTRFFIQITLCIQKCHRFGMLYFVIYEWILIIFGRNVTENVSIQTAFCFATSANYTTWQNAESKIFTGCIMLLLHCQTFVSCWINFLSCYSELILVLLYGSLNCVFSEVKLWTIKLRLYTISHLDSKQWFNCNQVILKCLACLSTKPYAIFK